MARADVCELRIGLVSSFWVLARVFLVVSRSFLVSVSSLVVFLSLSLVVLSDSWVFLCSVMLVSSSSLRVLPVAF